MTKRIPETLSMGGWSLGTNRARSDRREIG
jgi:hypothetical protein